MKKKRGKTTTEKQKEIQWFLNFIAIEDFEKLEDEKRAELAGVIKKHIHYQKLGERQEYSSPSKKVMGELKGLIDPVRLASFQKKIAEYFWFMILGIERTLNTAADNKWTEYEGTDFYPNLSPASIEVDIKSIIDGLEFEHKKKNGRNIESKLKPESIEKAFIDTSYDSSIAEGFFLYSFISLIDGVRITAFKKCPECGKWFINLTKMQKECCSNLCSSKWGQKKANDELERRIAAGDPEAIQEKEIKAAKSRTRSRKAYVKSIKENLPKQKNIGKRPRKPHWDREKGTFSE